MNKKMIDLATDTSGLRSTMKSRDNSQNLLAICDALKGIRSLCKAKAKITVSVLRCQMCSKEISLDCESEVIAQDCNCATLFHPFCYYSYFLPRLKNCRSCSKSLESQFDEISKRYRKTCFICKNEVTDDDMIQNCDCLDRRIHLNCIREKFKTVCNIHDFSCNVCYQPIPENTIEQAVLNNVYYCVKCNSQKPYNEMFFPDCRNYSCLNCFDYRVRVNIAITNIQDIRCIDLQCQVRLTFTELQCYGNSQVQPFARYLNEDGSQQTLMDLFNLARCPGYILVSKRKSTDLKKLSQSKISKGIVTLSVFENGDQNQQGDENGQRDPAVIIPFGDNKEHIFQEEIAYDANSEFTSFRICGRVWDVGQPEAAHFKCVDCGYTFCSECTTSHFNMSCEFYAKYSEVNKTQNLDTFIQYNQFNTKDRSSLFQLILDLMLDIELFELNKPEQEMRPPSRPQFLFERQYDLVYPPSQTFQSLRINYELFFGEAYDIKRSTWIPAFIPVDSTLGLRQILICGVEQKYHQDLFQDTCSRTNRQLVFQTCKFFNDFSQALNQSVIIKLQGNTIVKILLVCRINPKEILLPSMNKKMMLIQNPKDIRPYKIMLFPQNKNQQNQ